MLIPHTFDWSGVIVWNPVAYLTWKKWTLFLDLQQDFRRKSKHLRSDHDYVCIRYFSWEKTATQFADLESSTQAQIADLESTVEQSWMFLFLPRNLRDPWRKTRQPALLWPIFPPAAQNWPTPQREFRTWAQISEIDLFGGTGGDLMDQSASMNFEIHSSRCVLLTKIFFFSRGGGAPDFFFFF